MPYRFIVELIC
jgi:hypothetical protein